MYGLGAHEDRALASMPPHIRAVSIYALQDPGSRPEVLEILRSSNPTGRMASELNRAVQESFYGGSGMGSLEAGMGKSLSKRLKKAVHKVVAKAKDIHKAVEKKILPKPLQRIQEKARTVVSRVQEKAKKATKKVFIKYGNIILPVLGVVLAPFTGGASLAAAAVAATALDMYKKKEAARAALKAQKAEANVLVAQANAAEADLNRQADEVYRQYPQAFQAIGLSPSRWAALSVDAKVAVINALAEGKLPPGYSYVSEAEAAAAGAVAPQAGGGAARPSAGPAPAPGAPNYYYNYNGGSPQFQQSGDWGQPQEGEDEGQAAYVIFVEGKQVGVAKSADEAATLAMSKSSIGDRVEVFSNGTSTGLKLRSDAGMIAVPADSASKVKAMSHAEAVELVKRAQAESGQKSSGGLWWLLAIPAVLLASKAA